jgi:DNA-binding transcriptional ArsR family regulator
MKDVSIAKMSQAISHPSRLQLLRMLAQQTECRGADVFASLPVAKSTVSVHLRVLREAGLINSRVVGTSRFYCIVPGALKALGNALLELDASIIPPEDAPGRCPPPNPFIPPGEMAEA